MNTILKTDEKKGKLDRKSQNKNLGRSLELSTTFRMRGCHILLICGTDLRKMKWFKRSYNFLVGIFLVGYIRWDSCSISSFFSLQYI